MRYLFTHLKAYVKAYFSLKLYGATLLWVAFLLVVNFTFNIEDGFIDSFYGSWWRIFYMFLLQAVSFYGACWLIYQFTTYKAFFSDRRFWIISLSGFIILGFSRGNYYALSLVQYFQIDIQAYQYAFKTLMRWVRFISIMVPLLLMYLIFLKQELNHFYGLRIKQVNLKPYFVLLLLMVPIIALASFDPSFLKQYPNYNKTGIVSASAYLGWSERQLIYLYEFSYGLGFVAVELFFRGFLIFGLVKYLGPHVVLPMAVTYCALHFGKPLGEAISSIFGGYILGILALRTDNIYGGIIVHIGIAWLMELFAYWQMVW